ncbi:MAG TPA: hypothetical protein VGE08_25440 [Steroidobacter sp.]|uniref:hypothetical protein n=1 Tax=Steroidobacter sp. TaxID=1978227 RepID=UPI002ED87966
MFGALRERFTARESPAAIEERILALLRKPETQWTDACRSKATKNREQSLAVLSTIDAALTPAQRNHLQRELTKLSQQLEAMTRS